VELGVKAYKHPKAPVDIVTTCLRLMQHVDLHVIEGACFVMGAFLGKVLLASGREFDDSLERFMNFLLSYTSAISKDAIIYSLLPIFKV
jgi:hypothetical protein